MKPQTFALITAGVVGGTGLLGMIKALQKGTNEHVEDMKNFKGYSKIAGVIPTNQLFNWVRIGIGAAGLLASRSEKSSVIYNRSVAISYAGMAVMGVIPKANTMFGLMPIFGANVALHAGTAAAELLAEEELIERAGEWIEPLTPRIQELTAGLTSRFGSGQKQRSGRSRARA